MQTVCDSSSQASGSVVPLLRDHFKIHTKTGVGRYLGGAMGGGNFLLLSRVYYCAVHMNNVWIVS